MKYQDKLSNANLVASIVSKLSKEEFLISIGFLEGILAKKEISETNSLQPTG